MNFNALVNHIVKESLAVNIPVLDGEREIYYIFINDYLLINPDSGGMTRMSRGLNMWGHTEETIVSGYEQAMDIVKDQCRRKAWARYMSEQQLQEVIQTIVERLQPLKHIKGTWRVVNVGSNDYGGCVDVFSKEFIVGVEVDVDAYNTAKHAADDLKDF